MGAIALLDTWNQGCNYRGIHTNLEYSAPDSCHRPWFLASLRKRDLEKSIYFIGSLGLLSSSACSSIYMTSCPLSRLTVSSIISSPPGTPLFLLSSFCLLLHIYILTSYGAISFDNFARFLPTSADGSRSDPLCCPT